MAEHDTTGELHGDELASQLKSSVVFKGRDSVRDASLKLAPADLAWWRDAKFGLFLHWGLYAIPARGEWVMHNEQIPAAEYARLADEFQPRQFDASAWAAAANAAGMRYMVLTARHHDGFALWDSPASADGFCSTRTAAQRDFVAEYVAACRAAGLRVGLYYSPLDWRFPGYFRPRELADNAALLRQQGYGQVEELMTRYGPIDVLWYDGGWLAHQGTDADAAWFWEPLKLNALVRAHQPRVVINPRSGWEGDFQCDEGGHEVTGPIIDEPWEKCCNLNRPSWGYAAAQDLMSAPEIVRMLVNVVGRGGNLLLNVGPDRDGVIPPTHVDVLRQVGDWLAVNGAAIYDTRPGPLQPVDGRYCVTSRDGRLYVLVLDWGAEAALRLPPVAGRVRSAALLSGEPLTWTQSPDGLDLRPSTGPAADGCASVVELTLEG